MVQRLIEEYLAMGKQGNGDSADLDGSLFRPVANNRTGTLDKHLDPGSIYRNVVRQYARATGINAEVVGLCVHSLRATAATNALSNEADIAKVQEWLGHANVSLPGSMTGARPRRKTARHFMRSISKLFGGVLSSATPARTRSLCNPQSDCGYIGIQMLTPSLPASPKGFFDDFTYWLLVICAAITLLDWLMGGKRRERLRDEVADWWVYVESSSIGSYISLQARNLLARNSEIGHRVFSGSFYLGFFSLLASLFWCRHVFHTLPLKPGEVGFSPHVLIAPLLLGLGAAVAGIVLQEALLKRLSRTDTGLSVLFACSATFAYVWGVFVMILVSALLANFYEFSVRPLYQHHIVRLPGTQVTLHASILGATWSMPADRVVTIFALSWTTGLCLLPVLALILPQIVFAFSKMFGVFLKFFVSGLLERFYESKQGILTTLAVAAGALSKIIEETLKHFRA
jgi:hypothetical protein